jgi:hypothetical protein
MNEAKHTPGPWTAEWTHRNQHRTLGWHVGQPDTSNTVCVIEDDRGSDVDADRREADARLIAAAPDMLTSLKLITLWMRRASILNTVGAVGEILRHGEEAIKKAEGNQA